jgi:integrase
MEQDQQQQQSEEIEQRQFFEQRRPEIYPVTEGLQSKHTAAKYRLSFNQFLDYIKIHDLQVLLDLGRDAIQALVIKYVRDMRDNPSKKYARSTINVNCSAIHRFLVMNDITLNWDRIKQLYPPDELTHDDRAYTHDEISKILSVCDLRTRAIILLLVSSGMRIGAIPGLQISDLTPVKSRNCELYRIQVYARSRDKYYTFCTPESKVVIDLYLDDRQRWGEELKDRSPLFRKVFNKENPFTINSPRFLSHHTAMYLVDYVLKRSGVKTSEVMRSHAYRKGFKSICEESGMKSLHVEMLMGHHIPLVDSYYRPQEKDLLEDYVSHAVNGLTIDPRKRLERENQELKSERITKENLEELHREWLIELQKERALISLSEWNGLKKQLEEMWRLIQPIEDKSKTKD